jgi:hypothetical protein
MVSVRGGEGLTNDETPNVVVSIFYSTIEFFYSTIIHQGCVEGSIVLPVLVRITVETGAVPQNFW